MLWSRCQGKQHIRPIKGVLHRLVESQEQVATLSYTDSLEEQALLEHMLEQVKPPYNDQNPALHYLLRTPFRYPPLRWGSRFGSVSQPSLFYGALSVSTTLFEAAYYRCVLWASISAPPCKPAIQSQHTLFSVSYQAERGVQLQHAPFAEHIQTLTHPSHYGPCQTLGQDMRENGVEAFEYPSARDPEHKPCVGLFTPNAFSQKRPRDLSQWLCETTATHISFNQSGNRNVTRIDIAQFLIDGVLPLPA